MLTGLQKISIVSAACVTAKFNFFLISTAENINAKKSNLDKIENLLSTVLIIEIHQEHQIYKSYLSDFMPRDSFHSHCLTDFFICTMWR